MSLADRFRSYWKRTSPWLLLRFAALGLVLLPVALVVIMASMVKSFRWRNPAVCRRFILRHRLAFRDVDPSTLKVQAVSGGVSNCGLIWRCKTESGAEVEYFAKVFLPIGTLWARVCPLVSPMPAIAGAGSSERLTVDVVSRQQLANHAIPVPRLITFDPVDRVAVSERLRGTMVNDLLHGVAARGEFSETDELILRRCGERLGQIHAAGFSVVDAQPANCMWVPERNDVYFLDLEWCTRLDRRAWDAGFFVAFIGAQLEGPLEREARRIFFDGYRRHARLEPQAMAAAHQALAEFHPVLQAVLDLRRFTPDELVAQWNRTVEPPAPNGRRDAESSAVSMAGSSV
jgi:tRNA A-37 threonylcarbamoyl transferase component Bud32